MPTKIETETQLLRLLGNTPLQVDVELLQTATHVSKNVSQEHLTKFYKTFDEIKEKSASEGKTVYFEVSPLQWGLWTAGNGTFMDELAGICGLTNAFSDVNDWAAISEEQVLARDPDYIVTISMYYGEGPTPVEEIMGREGWQDLKAVKNGQVFNAESNAISRPGPRLKDAAIELFNFINGTAEAEIPAA